MFTPFGKALRQLRLDKELKLLDVARALGVSSAYVSSIETGRKPIPDFFVTNLRHALRLSEQDVIPLRRAADRTRKEVRVENLGADQREMVAAFARQIDDLPAEVLDEIRIHIMKSMSGEHPFARKRRGMVVQPMSTVALRDFAEKVRAAFVPPDDIEFPIMEVLELKLCKLIPDFYLEPREVSEMGGLEGLVVAGSDTLILRNDVYENACQGSGRDRFTACHELAHFLMHRSATLARVSDETVPIYCDSEWQADTFAGALMMSARHQGNFDSAAEAATECGMSLAAAKFQLGLYRRAP